MANKKYLVELSVDERAHLSRLIKKGKSSAQANVKARILLKADQGEAGRTLAGQEYLHCAEHEHVHGWSGT